MNKIRIAVDAMGGDNAPAAPVRGAVEALQNHPDMEVILLGDEGQIRKEMEGNICRCTGYARIADAIMLAAERINGPKEN